MERKESIGKDATSKETLQDVEENEAAVTDTSDDRKCRVLMAHLTTLTH